MRQWDDATWAESGVGGEVVYNVYRWYQRIEAGIPASIRWESWEILTRMPLVSEIPSIYSIRLACTRSTARANALPSIYPGRKARAFQQNG